jgi:hypothetical protein
MRFEAPIPKRILISTSLQIDNPCYARKTLSMVVVFAWLLQRIDILISGNIFYGASDGWVVLVFRQQLYLSQI